MNTRSAFLLASALFLAPPAHAQRDQIKLENVRAQTDEIQDAVRRAHQRLATVGAQAMTPGLAKTTIDAFPCSTTSTRAVCWRYGVFSYLRGFKVTLTSSLTVPFQQRPQVRWMHGKNN